MARFKNANWDLSVNANGNIETWQAVEIAVLMDIRDELQELNQVFRCPNFQSIPRELRAINRELKRIRKGVKS